MKLLRRFMGKCCHLFHINVSKIFAPQGRVLMLHWVGDEIQDEETEPYRISTEQCRRFLVWLKSKNTIRLENWEREEDFYALTIDDVPENFYYNVSSAERSKYSFHPFLNVSLLNKDGFITKGNSLKCLNVNFCTIGSQWVSHGDLPCSVETGLA